MSGEAMSEAGEEEDFADDYDKDDGRYPCPNCNGRGRAMEGWPCEECDGFGYLEFAPRQPAPRVAELRQVLADAIAALGVGE